MNLFVQGRAVHWYERIESTMIEAQGFARAGCPSGTVVGADEQTAGQGRLGRAWHSEPGSGLYVSIVLRLPRNVVPVITLALGLATAEAIEGAAGIACDLRWPNDVLSAGGRKLAGILTELCDDAIIAGIGINRNHAAFPPELAAIATSLRLESGREIAREALLGALLEAVDRQVAVLMELGKGATIDCFAHRSSYVHGRKVIVEQPDAPIRGVTDGLDSDGFLWVQTETGRRVRIVAGGVRPAEP